MAPATAALLAPVLAATGPTALGGQALPEAAGRPAGAGPGGGAYPTLPAASLEGGRLREVEVSGLRLRALLDGRPLELTAGSPFYRLDGGVGQLANPPYLRDGAFRVPMELLERTGAPAASSPGPSPDAGVAGRDGTRPSASGAGSGAPGRPSASGASAAADGVPSADDGAAGPRSGRWRVMIDPGHGGRDPGARGPGGTLEKDVTLALARKLRDRLRESGVVEPLLTREDDRFLPLAERSHMAVEREADLFLSIHLNSARDRRARGFETYFLGEARTEEARQVAIRENSSLRFEEGGGEMRPEELQVILANLDLRGYQQESGYLAGKFQNAFRGHLPAPDRGVKQNIFLVLVNASGSMPAVLVEVGFVSNRAGERFLRSGEGQERVVRGLSEAIVSYFRERDRRRMASGVAD